jgi:hypothetical protein
MPVVDMTRRLPAKTIGADIDSLNGLGTVEGYTPVRPDAAPKELKASFATMQAMQQKETEQQADAESRLRCSSPGRMGVSQLHSVYERSGSGSVWSRQ